MRAAWLALFCLATSLLASAAHGQSDGQSDVSARVIWYGAYTPSEVKIVDDPRSPTGHVSIQTPIAPTTNADRIPGREGVRFGLSFMLSGNAGRGVTVRRVFRFPGAGMPNKATGSQAKTYEDTATYPTATPLLMAWSFKDARPEQILLGDWVFEVWVAERKVVDRRFTVYRP